MEVILSQNVPSLGAIGSVVKVKNGYARNYLFPKNLAYLATPTNLKRITKLEEKRQAMYQADKKVADDLAEQLSKASCTVNVEVNDLDKLYGSVTDSEIIRALEGEGFTIEKKQIVIEKPIEELGIFEIGIKLHPEVTAKVRLWVTKK